METYSHLFPMIKISKRSIYRYIEKLIENNLITGIPGPYGLEFDPAEIDTRKKGHDRSIVAINN